MAFYDAIPASDGTSLNAPSNAEFKVYEVFDTARAVPLPLRTTAGTNAAPLITTAQGVVPPVEVVSPNFEHVFKSGDWEWRRESTEGIRREVADARAAAIEAAAETKKPTDAAVNDGIARADLPALAASAVAAQPTVAAAAAAATTDAVANMDLIQASDPRTLRTVEAPSYALPFVDREGYVAAGIQTDGVFNMEMPPRIVGEGGVTLLPLNGSQTEWAIPFADEQGFVAGGIRHDGTAEFFKLKHSPETALNLANEIVGYTRSSRTHITCVGDSLTAGYFPGTTVNWGQSAYPSVLSRLLPDVQVFNAGTSGYTVDEEAIRIGAFPLPLTVEGGSIPATGPVQVTTNAVIGWRPAGVERTMKGTLGGVPGTLMRRDSNTSFTFTRTTAGNTTPVPAGTLFKPDFAGHESDTIVLMLGRNNIPGITGADARAEDNVVNGIRRIIDWLAPQLKQALILSTTTNSLEKRGTPGHTSIQEINTRLRALYPSKFLDIRAYLVRDAIHDLGITPTPEDVACIEGDTLPPSIMLDNTHYKPETAALVAAKVNDYLTTRGWV